ncbi:MAG: hypothetical protein ABR507_09395 [Actinomycetota bacterium]|nr:hypothetical protein [Actinomycetota bacterium]
MSEEHGKPDDPQNDQHQDSVPETSPKDEPPPFQPDPELITYFERSQKPRETKRKSK